MRRKSGEPWRHRRRDICNERRLGGTALPPRCRRRPTDKNRTGVVCDEETTICRPPVTDEIRNNATQNSARAMVAAAEPTEAFCPANGRIGKVNSFRRLGATMPAVNDRSAMAFPGKSGLLFLLHVLRYLYGVVLGVAAVHFGSRLVFHFTFCYGIGFRELFRAFFT